ERTRHLPSVQYAGRMTAPATPRKRWRPVARAAVTVVVLVAVGWLFWRALSENWEQVRAHDLSPNWLMALAVVIFAAAVPVSGLPWGAILNWLRQRRGVDRES